MKKNFKIKIFVLIAFAFIFSRQALAASLVVAPEENILQEDEVFTLSIELNTEGLSINTIGGDLTYDENFIKPQAVSTGASFVSFWLERPEIKTPGLIHFSGITPGGISVPDGQVFNVIFKTQRAGDTSVSLQHINLYLNDGAGSVVSAKINNADIKINPGKSSNASPDSISLDKSAPDKFSIVRAQSPLVFDNKWFIAFSTQDKESGIGHYQVCELFYCVSTESPYLLKNQTLFYFIFLRAYDVNGNTRASFIISPWLTGLIVVIIFICVVFLLYKKRLKNS
jgi:hypothetical protein